MAFTYKLGSLSLQSYVRVSPGEGFDPYGAGNFVTPSFTDAVFGEGQALSAVDVANREHIIPLFLSSSASKDNLHALIRDVNNELKKPFVQVEWKDAGATKSSFFYVTFGKLEPDFSFRRSEKGYFAGNLHLWVTPYADVGSYRTIVTQGTGRAVVVSAVPSAGGDVTAHTQITQYVDMSFSAGSQSYGASEGVITFAAALPHASWLFRVPVASLVRSIASSVVTGASNAPASQYLGIPVCPTGVHSGFTGGLPDDFFANITIPIPSVHAGKSMRVLTTARNRMESPIAIRAFGNDYQPIGPTAAATAHGGFALIDLGRVTVPTAVDLSQYTIRLQAGGVNLPTGIDPFLMASPALHLGEVYLLPEDNTSIAMKRIMRTVSADDFYDTTIANNAFADSRVDALGNPAYTAVGSLFQVTQYANGILYTGATTGGVSNWYVQKWQNEPPAKDIWVEARAGIASQTASQYLLIGKSLPVGASQYITTANLAGLLYNAQGSVFLTSAVGSLGLSRASSVFSFKNFKLRWFQLGDYQQTSIEMEDGTPIFNAAGSGLPVQVVAGATNNGLLKPPGYPGLVMHKSAGATNTMYVLSMRAGVYDLPTTETGTYIFDSEKNAVIHQGGAERPLNTVRGRPPKVSTPSPGPVVSGFFPMGEGHANPLVTQVVKLKERFFYAV